LTQLRTNLLQPTISYTQEWQDRLKQDPIVAVKGIVFSDKTGTLYIDESDDKSTITQLAEKLVSANVTSEQDWVKLTKRWYRFRYVNGASAQGEFILLQDIDKSGELRSGILASPGVVVNTQLTGSYVSVDAVIALNGTLSTEIDFRNFKYLSIRMPDAWTAATLTIKGSATAGGTKRVIKNDVGVAFAPMTVAVDEIYSIDVQSLMLAGVFFLSLEASVAQAAERTIKVMMKA